MSNPFTIKPNSDMRGNTFTSDRRNTRGYLIDDYHRKRDAELQAKRDQEAAEKQRAYEAALDMASYPALSKTTPISTSQHVKPTSYADQIKKERVDELVTQVDIDLDIANLKPGYTLVRKEGAKGIQMYKNTKFPTECNTYSDDENVISYKVFEALADLHESRTNHSIELYGYEVWENIFKHPRWREDQLYWKEMEADVYASSEEELDNDLDDDLD